MSIAEGEHVGGDHPFELGTGGAQVVADGRQRDVDDRDAAMRILDAEGLDNLSMRRVADELDTGAASLYWHVGSKDGLLDLVFDQVIGEQHVPDPAPARWQEQLRDVAHTMRAAILRHRDIVRISIVRVPMGPNALRYSERVLAILRASGVPTSSPCSACTC